MKTFRLTEVTELCCHLGQGVLQLGDLPAVAPFCKNFPNGAIVSVGLLSRAKVPEGYTHIGYNGDDGNVEQFALWWCM